MEDVDNNCNERSRVETTERYFEDTHKQVQESISPQRLISSAQAVSS